MARIKTRRQRRQTPGKFKLRVAPWVDPNPTIDGTEPEKRVFAALQQRGIYFIFQGQIPELEVAHREYFLQPVPYKPDFVLPEYKLIIDPFSPFHHSLKEAAKRDVDKVARYNSMGYAYYHPWAIGPGIWTWDQRHDLVERKLNSYRKLNRKIEGRSMGTLTMLGMIPELNMGPRYPLFDPRDKKCKQHPGYRIGQFLGAGANSVAAANHLRTKPKLLSLNAGSRQSTRRAGTRA